VNTSQIIDLILALVTVAPELVNRLMATAQQTGELTPEQWAALKARADALFASPAWTPTPPAGG
jgi:hypothetical protein